MSERRNPEAQFQLANERTYLAWLRTALALVASGVAAARLLAGQTLHWAWETVGVLLIVAGVVTAALARRRWRAMDAAIREGEPLPAPGHRRDDRGGHRDLWAHHHRAPARDEPGTRSVIDPESVL
jgi:putative membrane protein